MIRAFFSSQHDAFADHVDRVSEAAYVFLNDTTPSWTMLASVPSLSELDDPLPRRLIARHLSASPIGCGGPCMRVPALAPRDSIVPTGDVRAAHAPRTLTHERDGDGRITTCRQQ